MSPKLTQYECLRLHADLLESSNATSEACWLSSAALVGRLVLFLLCFRNRIRRSSAVEVFCLNCDSIK